jgi:HTH-type transcriptional regulator/antitoxin HigA
MTKNAIAVRPIHTEEDHDAALARIDELMSAKFGTPEGDELDVLVTLVDAYETKHFPMDAPDPVVAIEFMMEQQGLTRKDLEPMIGSRSRVSEVLSGKRPLTLAMIRRLHAGLGIAVDVLVGANVKEAKPKRRAGRNAVAQADRPLAAMRRA